MHTDAFLQDEADLAWQREREADENAWPESILLSAKVYVNVYSVGRAYGGPEEGGWWFDTGHVVSSTPFAGRDAYMDAVRHADSLRESHAENGMRREDRNGGIGRFSVMGGDDLVVVVEDHQGENYPAEWPHYE